MDTLAVAQLATTFPLATVWEQFSSSMPAGRAARDLVTAIVFHSALDGTTEDAPELVEECGGVDSDVPLVLQLWELARLPADRGVRGIAHTHRWWRGLCRSH